LLELGSTWCQRKVERRELAGEVGVKLVRGGLERLSLPTTRVGLTELVVVGAVPLQIHVEATDLTVVGHNGQVADHAVDHGVGTHQAASSSGIRLIG
jgi:hypothetical protein